ncbi:MAG: GMP synthase (glutamine-hydrolyzing), partial [Gammaproteobacteria bacterium]|nr:GMP synthase (glutamine-hydrolyzing) [Gammaproteobacteria bacterium]
MDLHEEKILILDFGSQYTQLIARKIREIGIYCEIRAYDIQPDELNQFAPNGIVLSGGPESATENTSVDIPEHVFSSGVPVLGICYGMQAMASQLGGKVEESNKKEFGFANVKLERSSDLLGSLGDTENSDHSLDVWMSHGDKVASLPAGFSVIGSSNNSPIAIMADEKRKLYGLQFHPEVDHTAKGKAILDRFVKVICGCKAIWTPGNIANDLVKKIRDEVGDKKVLLGLSGGVDSSVVASLLARAIGSQLTC